MTDPAGHGADGELFTNEEYEEYFGGDYEPLAPKSRRLPLGVKLLGYFVALAMGVGGLLTLGDALATTPDVREPLDIEQAAWDRVAESDYGWLVEDIVIRPILDPAIGAFVTNNPPDGIIHIDERPWQTERLNELMDHEIGHLLDFALWEPRDPLRKGGLETEVWAECAAVVAGTRRVDPRTPGGEYHCVERELAAYVSTLAEVTEVCARWADRECQQVTPPSIDE